MKDRQQILAAQRFRAVYRHRTFNFGIDGVSEMQLLRDDMDDFHQIGTIEV